MPKKRLIKFHIILTALLMSLCGSECWTLMKEQKENEDGRNYFLQAFVIYAELNGDVRETLEQDDIHQNKRQMIRREGLSLAAALTISTKLYNTKDIF